MTDTKKNILIYYAHPTPHKSKINRALIDAVNNIPGVTIRRLYDLYPDFYIDVPLEQKLIMETDIIIWHHPFYWYSAPSILKEWIDLVLEHGFAYGEGGNALKGKKVMTAITTGGREEAYSKKGRNRFTIRELLAPFEQTAILCKMQYLPPFVAHGSLIMGKQQIEQAATTYKQIIISLRDDLFEEDEFLNVNYMNEILK